MSCTRKVCTGIAVAFLLGTLGCSGSDEPAVTTDSGKLSKVIRTAYIAPKQVRANNYTEVAFKRAAKPESFTYRWFRNGEVIEGADGYRLGPEHFRRGDRIAAEVLIPSSGYSFTTDAVDVLNTPPQIVSASASIEGTGGQAQIVAQVDAQDADNDPIDYIYRWHRNATLINGESGQALAVNSTERGDIIYAEVVASDGIAQSTVYRTPTVTVENHPPKIVSEPGVPNGQMFVYEVKAEDPDSDLLSYDLLVAPPGMTIDSRGRVQWQMPTGEDRTGTHNVTIQVSDARGALATQTFTITF